MKLNFRNIKNFAWALRAQQFNNQTQETRTLMQRAVDKVGSVNVVIVLCDHIKKRNEKINALKVQVRFLNDLIKRRKVHVARKNKIFRKFYDQVETEMLNVKREEFYKKNPDRVGTLMTDAESADLIFAAKRYAKELLTAAKHLADMPF